MGGVDRAHVARVVEDASRGSRYSARAEAKEAALTEQIEAMKQALARRPRAELEALDAAMGRLRARMEASRRLDRVCAVVDFDAFFAAVEERDDPSLRGVPFAVGGMSMISTASYAARKFGVRSAMPGFIAIKLCPALRFVKHSFGKYENASALGRAVFERFDADASMMSLDEAYMDLTAHLCGLQQPDGAGAGAEGAAALSAAGLPPVAVIEAAVAGMRREVAAATGGLTVSAGVAANTLLAKIVSDQRKPDGQFLLEIAREPILEFMRALPVRKLPGVGKVTERQLVELGFAACGDILERPGVLRAALGERMASWLLRSALGLSEEDYSLAPAAVGGGSSSGGGGGGTTDEAARAIGRKSISQERTFNDCGSLPELVARVGELARMVASQMQAEGIVGRTVALKLKHADFTVSQKQAALRRPTADGDALCKAALALLQAAWPVTLRLVGVRVSALQPAASKPTLLDSYFGRAAAGPATAAAAAGAAGCEPGDDGDSSSAAGGAASSCSGGDSDEEVQLVCVASSGGSGAATSTATAAAAAAAPWVSGATRGDRGAGAMSTAAPPFKVARRDGASAAASASSAREAGDVGSSDSDGGAEGCDDVEVIELSADEEEDDEEQGEGGRGLAASAGHGASDCGDDEVVVIGSQGDGGDASAAAMLQPQPRATQPPSLFAALAHAAAAGGRLSVAPRSCPVCAHSLGVTMTSAEVNAHVDACLRRGHRDGDR